MTLSYIPHLQCWRLMHNGRLLHCFEGSDISIQGGGIGRE